MDKTLPRTLATAALTAHEQVTDLMLAQGKLVEDATTRAFASARAGMQLHRDLSVGFAKTWLDAVVPAPEAKA